MGGQSSSKTTQNSTTAPWTEAQPQLQGILSQLTSNLGNTGVTGAESGALTNIVNNANTASSQYGQPVADYAKSLLSGGGATDQAGNVNANYQRYVDQTNPLASNTNYNPYDTPGFKDALSTTIADITNATNGQFAAAGRDFSGMNSQTLGRGILQGVADHRVAVQSERQQPARRRGKSL